MPRWCNCHQAQPSCPCPLSEAASIAYLVLSPSQTLCAYWLFWTKKKQGSPALLCNDWGQPSRAQPAHATLHSRHKRSLEAAHPAGTVLSPGQFAASSLQPQGNCNVTHLRCAMWHWL